ncbi:MAG: hypothetical protein NC084_06155, partial [Bacteroides sp.]|nr:hypothetical protein [Eubacterium sp.]MCM1418192.1 hypothetical protein [Roseburia sp.]MCM1462283.1 hypothetical protein [Bacteroides sp.]
MNQNEINKLADTLLNVTTNVTNQKVSGAQYDKSFQTKIVGVNQMFSDEIPEETQQELIKKYTLEEGADPCYYTFILDEAYYVKKSDVKFQLYQDVVIRIPNGNWDRMYIEGSDSQEVAEPAPYTAGQGITITGQEIGLKVAGKGSYYDGNWKNLIGGVYIDTMTTGSANSLNVDNMGILRLLPAKVGTIGGVSPGLGLRRSSASSTDTKGEITVNVGKGLSLTKKSSYNSTYDSGYEITPKLGEGLYFDDDGKINVLTSDESGGGGAGYVIKAQGINIYAENYLNAFSISP